MVPGLLPFVVGSLVFGVAPGLVLRALIRLYPSGHHRREELPAEFYTLPVWRRVHFVTGLLELALLEGVPARLSRSLRQTRDFIDTHSTPQLGLALVVVGPVMSGLAINLATEPRAALLAKAVFVGVALLGSLMTVVGVAIRERRR